MCYADGNPINRKKPTKSANKQGTNGSAGVAAAAAEPVAAAAPAAADAPSLAGVKPDVEEWKKVKGLECTDRCGGFINENSDPVLKGGVRGGNMAPSFSPPTPPHPS